MKLTKRTICILGTLFIFQPLVAVALVWHNFNSARLPGTYMYRAGPADSLCAFMKYRYILEENGSGKWIAYEGPSWMEFFRFPAYRESEQRPLTYTVEGADVTVKIEGRCTEVFRWSPGWLRGETTKGFSRRRKPKDLKKEWR